MSRQDPNRRCLVAAILAFVLMAVMGAAGIAAPVYPARPDPPRLMNDLARMFSPSEREQLEDELLSLNRSTGVQFTVVTVPDLRGVSPEEYSVKLFEKWGIGEAGADNGLLLLISESEHELRFETGYGLEGDLPDAYLGRIIDEALIPNFRNGRPAAGVAEAIARIRKRLSGEEAQTVEGTRRMGHGLSEDALAGFIILMVFIVYLFVKLMFRGPRRPPRGPGSGGTGRPPSVGPFIPPPPGGWGGMGGFGKGPTGGFGKPSGGGFGGFGGGKSGGGGAGGKW